MISMFRFFVHTFMKKNKKFVLPFFQLSALVFQLDSLLFLLFLPMYLIFIFAVAVILQVEDLS